MSSRPRVFLSHDGAIDELLALFLLAVTPDAELLGVSCVNGDCLAETAMRVQDKLLTLAGQPQTPRSLSKARAFNPFPWRYRSDCVRFAALPALSGVPDPDSGPPFPDGEERLTAALESSSEGGLTLLFTGPLTPLQLVLGARPDLESRIAQVIWMGGAVGVAGNLEPETLPGVEVGDTAEWNAFWDPFAVDWIFRRTSFPLTLVPLDVSDQTPITPDFLAALDRAAASSPAAGIAAQGYRLVADQPLYRLWDMTAAVYALHPELFATPTPMRLGVETWGIHQGAVRPGDQRDALVVANFAPGGRKAMYEFIVEQLSVAVS